MSQDKPKRKLPPPKPLFSEKTIQFVLDETRDMLEGNNFLSSAKHCGAFEKEYADYCGCKHGLTTSSGTASLEVALRSLDVQGGEVIVPTLTFGATALAVIAAGARPVFVDCGPDMQVNPDLVAKRIGADTKAVITVHIGGYLAENLPKLVDLCNDKKVPLVEDAAHAHGSALNGKRAGSFGKVGCFSFFSTKVIPAGEGGALVTDDEEIIERGKVFRNQGKARNTNYHEGLGLHARMTEMQAMLLRGVLSEVEGQIDTRHAVARVYDEKLASVPGLEIYKEPEGLRANYYKYIAFLPAQGRQNDARQMLRERWGVGITGYVYELPLHRMPAFKEYAQGCECPVADDLCRRHICPPIHPGMNEEDAAYVASCLEDVMPDLQDAPEGEAPFLLP